MNSEFKEIILDYVEQYSAKVRKYSDAFVLKQVLLMLEHVTKWRSLGKKKIVKKIFILLFLKDFENGQKHVSSNVLTQKFLEDMFGTK
jgi:hypothetical protein